MTCQCTPYLICTLIIHNINLFVQEVIDRGHINTQQQIMHTTVFHMLINNTKLIKNVWCTHSFNKRQIRQTKNIYTRREYVARRLRNYAHSAFFSRFGRRWSFRTPRNAIIVTSQTASCNRRHTRTCLYGMQKFLIINTDIAP